ncbi:MAG: hypothetical protein H0U57_12980 [Tatlockia sp.]|nr:hypothetical protein [Tatlockia sp.]
MPIFDFKDFTASTHIPRSSKNAHNLWKGTIKGSNRVWFCKAVENLDIALKEVVVQEFFRVIVPYQPETRIAYDKSTGLYYILSEEIAEFNYSESNFRKQVKTGLGKTLLLALFLEEDDLKFNNIGLDNQNRVIKIDGGLCFSGDKHPFNLSDTAIKGLPFPVDCQPTHWLDIIKNGKKHAGSFIVSQSLSSSPEFRNDVNQTMLRICLIPDGFIIDFVDFLTEGSSIQEKFITKLINRRDELLGAALNNSSFFAYLNTPAAQQEALDFSNCLLSFNSARKFLINNIEQKEEFVVEFNNRKRALFTVCANQLINQINMELQAHLFDINFKQFNNLVEMAGKLILITDNYDNLNTHLTHLLNSIVALKQRFRGQLEELVKEFEEKIVIQSNINHNNPENAVIKTLELVDNSIINEPLNTSNFNPGFWQNPKNSNANIVDEKELAYGNNL